MTIKATVLVPTTKNRGVLLPYSIGSIQNQTVKDIEIFVIGDGVDDDTRQVINALKAKDNRIKFFDHPKHKRRGETYRHQALMEHAKGEIVCYLLDRDLMLPHHIECMLNHLQQHNFCVNTSIFVREDGWLSFVRKRFFGDCINDNSATYKKVKTGGFLFSQVGHTLEFYKQLPEGWRTTPSTHPTDIYMWLQFFDHSNLKFTSTFDFTILYFKRGNYPGWPAEKRAEELKKYSKRLHEHESLKREALFNSLNEKEDLLLSPLLVRGRPLSMLPKRIYKSLRQFFIKRR